MIVRPAIGTPLHACNRSRAGRAIDELIAESGLDAEEVADMLESMAPRYREQANDEEEAGDE